LKIFHNIIESMELTSPGLILGKKPHKFVLRRLYAVFPSR
jgi:hypothetical protein